jgi:hypothetical protein
VSDAGVGTDSEGEHFRAEVRRMDTEKLATEERTRMHEANRRRIVLVFAGAALFAVGVAIGTVLVKLAG